MTFEQFNKYMTYSFVVHDLPSVGSRFVSCESLSCMFLSILFENEISRVLHVSDRPSPVHDHIMWTNRQKYSS